MGEGGRVAVEEEETVEAVEDYGGIGGDEEVASEAEGEIGVGAEGEEAEEACGDVEEDEEAVSGHDMAAPGHAVTEREAAGTGPGVGGEEMVDAAVLLVPEGLEVGKEGVFVEGVKV